MDAEQKNSKQLNPMPRFTMAMLVTLKPDGAARLAQFRQQAAALFAKYDLRIERMLKITGKGQIVGENRFAQPDLIQQLSFPSLEQFKAYASDPHYLSLAAQRDEGIARLTVLAGAPMDVSGVATAGSGTVANRLYGLGLIRFKVGGAAGMDTFNQRAQSLFARHGMHIESMLDVKQTMTPLGESEGMNPERLVLFFLDDAAALKGYANDPEYHALAPLRDAGLEAYDFFLGQVVMPPASVR